MAIANSVQDDHGSGLSPADFRARCAEGGGASCVEMSQEHVIALLLQQQQEVLREVRDQRKVREDSCCVGCIDRLVQKSPCGLGSAHCGRVGELFDRLIFPVTAASIFPLRTAMRCVLWHTNQLKYSFRCLRHQYNPRGENLFLARATQLAAHSFRVVLDRG